jgi:hypothetical protein
LPIRVPGARRHTLTEYQRHAELYGSECVLETAAGDLDETELDQLAAFVGHMERVSVFRHRQWTHHGQEMRVCEECGKDLPKGSSRRMLRHPHCARRVAKRRRRATAH